MSIPYQINLTKWKIAICVLCSASILFINNFFVLLTIFSFISFFILYNKLGWQQLKHFIIVNIYTVVMLLIMHGLSHSLKYGIIIGLQMSCIIWISCYLVKTTNEIDLINSVESFLQPLKKFGIPAEKISLSLWVALRSMHLLTRHFHEIQQAQRARGLSYSALRVLIPLLLKTFQSADHLVEALVAKGYEVE